MRIMILMALTILTLNTHAAAIVEEVFYNDDGTVNSSFYLKVTGYYASAEGLNIEAIELTGEGNKDFVMAYPSITNAALDRAGLSKGDIISAINSGIDVTIECKHNKISVKQAMEEGLGCDSVALVRSQYLNLVTNGLGILN
jgi:hypothetical protein